MGSAAGYSGTPLIKKLGLKVGMSVRLLNPPEDYWKLLGTDPISMGVDVVSIDSVQKADFTHLFAADLEALDRAFSSARSGMHQEGVVWASWPKKSSRMKSQIGRSEVMRVGKGQGLVDIKVCAVDEIWSGLKFMIPVDRRR